MPNGIKRETLLRLQSFVNSDKFQQVKPETQQRLLKFLSQQSTTFEPLMQTRRPVFGATQVIPRSPIGPLGRFRLGLATPKGRQELIRREFGTFVGAPGREAVFTERGLQAISPRGFELGDIPEFAARAPSIAAEIGGGAIGGILGAPGGPGTSVVGAAVGSAIGATAGELNQRILGRVLGVREDKPLVKDLAEAVGQGALAGTLNLAFAGAGRALRGTGRAFAGVGRSVSNLIRRLGKANKMTVEWLEQRVKKVGAKVVFQPEKLDFRYGTKTLIPRLRQGVTNLLDNFTNNTARFLKKFDVSDDTIIALKNRGHKSIRQKQSLLRNSSAEVSERINLRLGEQLTRAGDKFDDILRRKPGETLISSNRFLNSIRNELKRLGLMNADNSFRAVDMANVPSQHKRLIAIHNELARGVVTPGKVRATGKIPLNDYFRFKGLLDDSVRGNANDIAIFRAKQGLVDDAVESIPGLREANKAYAKAKQLFDEFATTSDTGITGEKTLAKTRKLTQRKKKQLLRLDEEIPFMDDLEDLQTAQELDKFLDKEFNPDKIESMFGRGQQQLHVRVRDTLEEIDSFLSPADKFYADYRDWLAHLDLQDAGAYAARGGAIRVGAEALERQFFQRGLPAIEATKRVLGPPVRLTGQAARQVLQPQFGRFRFPTTPAITRQAIRGQQ